ncbi:hypothetical protein A8V49_08910 [Yersinia pestis]|nr:hypothetical protein A8V49_08910 [Yersinia pestis]
MTCELFLQLFLLLIFTTHIPHDPRVEEAIGMADHNAKGAIDPLLPHRLDPFYPQAVTFAMSVTQHIGFRDLIVKDP